MKEFMNKLLELRYTIGFDSIFPKKDKLVFLDYLNGIKKKQILDLSISLLTISDKSSKHENYKDFLNRWFLKENIEFENFIALKCFEKERELGQQVTIVNTKSSLLFLEYIFNYNENREFTLPEERIKENLLKAYLIINQNTNDSESCSANYLNQFDKEKKLPRLLLTLSFPNASFEFNDLNMEFVSQTIKSLYLFGFLKSIDNSQNILPKFLENYGFLNSIDYFSNIMLLGFYMLNNEQGMPIDIIIPEDKDINNSKFFLDRFVLEESSIINEYDFTKLREKPLYYIGNGRYRIIYNLFVIELIYNGLYFKLKKIYESIFPEKDNFRSIYTSNFSEKHLFYNTLKRIFKNKYVQISGEEFAKKKFMGAPDYYIRNGNKIFLFEAKDSLINAGIIHSYDCEKYESELKKKLYIDIDKNKPKNKAIKQLSLNIEKIVNNEFPIDTNFKGCNTRIYSIIVVFNLQFNLAGLNMLLKEWFDEEMHILGLENKTGRSIKYPILLSIDDLIVYEFYSESNKISLTELIDDYLELCFPKKKIKDDTAENKEIQRYQPFSSFLNEKLSKLNLKYGIYKDKLLELIKKV
jgi:hypothetical protein